MQHLILHLHIKLQTSISFTGVLCCWVRFIQHVPGDSMVKNPHVHAGDTDFIPGLGRCLGGGHGNPLQYSCLENPLDRGTCYVIVHRVAKSWTRLKLLSMHAQKAGHECLSIPFSDGPYSHLSFFLLLTFFVLSFIMPLAFSKCKFPYFRKEYF